MANVNIGQLRTLLQNLQPTQHVRVQAGFLLAVLNGYKGLNGNADIATAQQNMLTGSQLPEVDLTAY